MQIFYIFQYWDNFNNYIFDLSVEWIIKNFYLCAMREYRMRLGIIQT